MKKSSPILAVLGLMVMLVTGCHHRPYLSQDQFYSYPRGSSISTVIDEMGKPDMVRDNENGDGQDYIYIDRIEVSRDIIEHIHYIYHVRDGEIVDREIERVESLYPDININNTRR